MKVKVVILIVLLAALKLSAQQLGMYSHYFYKPMIYNPAFTGNENATNVMVVSRSQWTDFRNAPQLNILSADGRFMNEKAGLGVTVISDKKGLSNRTSGYLNYAYRLKITDDMHVLFGASFGAVNHQFNFTNALVENNTDPTLFTSNEQKTTLDANAGIGLIWKGLEFGVSVPQLIGNKVNYVDNESTRAYYTHTRHYLGTLKYKYFISKDKGISIAPMGLVRFVPNTPFQYDGNLNFEWQDKFWIGATYKSDYAVGGNAGFCIHKQLYIGYSYDFIIGSIGKYAGTSHEIMVNFKFGKNKKQTPEPIAEEVKKEPVESVAKNAAYEKRMDSLHQALAESQKKIEELSKKIDQQGVQLNQVANTPPKLQIQTQQEQTPPQNNQPIEQTTPVNVSENQNSVAIQSNTSKTIEEGVWMAANDAADFTDDKNTIPEGSFYVIVGTFTYRDLAIAEAKRYKEKGYSANWIFFGPKNYNYVYITKLKSKTDAVKKAKEMQSQGVKDAWVQLILD